MQKIASVLILLVLSACGPTPWSGNGIVRSFTRDLGTFNGLNVTHGFTVQLRENRQRAYPEVRMSIDDNLANFVGLQNISGILNVQLNQPVQAQQQLLEITSPGLRRISFAGRTQGTLDALSGQSQVEIELTGNSQLTITKLESDVLRVKLSSNSRLTIDSGTVSTLMLENLSTRSSFSGENLLTQRVEAVMSTGATARVQALRQLSVKMADNASIAYKGTPQIQQQLLSRDAKVTPIN